LPVSRALQGLVDKPPTKFPCEPLTESDVHPLSTPPHILPDPPNRAPTKRDAPFPESSNYLLKFPVNGLPRFPNGSLRRETSVFGAVFYTFPSKSLVNEPPSIFPNWVPKDREALSPEPMVCSFIYICQSPIRSPPTKNGENIWSPSTEPHVDGTQMYSGLWPGSPRALLMTLHSLPQCHATFSTIPSSLAWVDQGLFSQHVS